MGLDELSVCVFDCEEEASAFGSVVAMGWVVKIHQIVDSFLALGLVLAFDLIKERSQSDCSLALVDKRHTMLECSVSWTVQIVEVSVDNSAVLRFLDDLTVLLAEVYDVRSCPKLDIVDDTAAPRVIDVIQPLQHSHQIETCHAAKTVAYH